MRGSYRNHRSKKKEILSLVDDDNYIDMTITEISEKFNMHYDSVRRFLKNNDIKTLNRAEVAQKEILQLVDENNYIDMNKSEVLSKTNVTSPQLTYITQKYNITYKKSTKTRLQRNFPELYEEIQNNSKIESVIGLANKYYTQGVVVTEIYKEIYRMTPSQYKRKKKEEKINKIYENMTREQYLKTSTKEIEKRFNIVITNDELSMLKKKYKTKNKQSEVRQLKVKLVQSLTDEEIKSYTYKSIQEKLGINQQIFQAELKRRGIKKVSQRKRAMEYFKENGTCSYKDYHYKDEVTSNAFSVYKLDFNRVQDIKNKK